MTDLLSFAFLKLVAITFADIFNLVCDSFPSVKSFFLKCVKPLLPPADVWLMFVVI